MPLDDTLAARFPRRATTWRLRTCVLDLPEQPLVMGVVNVTPDSFSDGGQFLDARAAIDRAFELVAAGATMIDIGGESTRPYATPVASDEELRRVLPVVREVCARADVCVSIDTTKARVAAAALAAGAEIINDVSGLEADPDMVRVAVESGAGVCAMHMQGTPRTMQDCPAYHDVVEDILQYLRARRDALVAAGIDRQRICLDPGIGFGKTHRHNVLLLARSARFHELGCPLLVGPSRKRFIAKVLGQDPVGRSAGTIGVVLALARQGVQIVRVHDVREVWEALRLYAATGGIDGRVELPD
jgi:dihydropteroate synthase